MTFKTSPSKLPLEKPFPRSMLRKHVDFMITELPFNESGIRKKDISPGVTGAFQYVTDEKIIWDDSPDKKTYYKWGWIVLALDILLILIGIPGEDDSLFWPIFFGTIFFIPVVWCFSYWKYAPDKKVIILNRLEGTIELPGMLWDEPHLVKFENLHAVIAASKYNMYLAVVKTRSWKDRNFSTPIYFNLGGWAPWESMSYWVWYMDKTAPTSGHCL